MTTAASESQKLTQDKKVRLLTITKGDVTIRITDAVKDDTVDIEFDEVQYFGRKFKLTGFEVTAAGALPRPTLKIDNTDGLFWPLCVEANRYLAGAAVNYKEVYRENLDDGTDPDPTQIISEHNYVIRQMQRLHRVQVTFQLAVEMDLEQYMFGVQLLRNGCRRRYRVPDPENPDEFFQYNCPWGDQTKRPGSGTPYFKKDGTSTASWLEDDCGGQYADCVRRFHNVSDDVKLPYWGAPNIGTR